MVAFLYNELEDREKNYAEAHLEICPKCKDEFRRLQEIYEAADSLKPDIEKAVGSVNWDKLPTQIAGGIFGNGSARERKARPTGLGAFLSQPRLRPAYAGLLLGIMVGAIATFLILRSPSVHVAGDGKIIAPQGFYDKMELEMARRETIEYLDRSEYLLLDFVQSAPEKSVEFWQSEYASQKAKDLLSKKKYIDPQLAKIRLAKAKVICDQIELLFFELMQVSEELSVEELTKIQRLIQERQLLLKIKLVRKELQNSEV